MVSDVPAGTLVASRDPTDLGSVVKARKYPSMLAHQAIAHSVGRVDPRIFLTKNRNRLGPISISWFTSCA